MEIYKVDDQYYTNWNQARLNALKTGYCIYKIDVIESDGEEVDMNKKKEISILFENGQTFEVDVQLVDEQESKHNDPDCLETVWYKEIGSISLILKDYEKSVYLSKSNLDEDLKKDIEYYAERYRDLINEENEK